MKITACRSGLSCLLFAAWLTHFVGFSRVATAFEEPSSKVINRAHEFLKTKSNGEYILSFVHMGAQYRGHDCLGWTEVLRNGRAVPGHFALVYEFEWEDDGRTRIAFLCNGDGDVYDVQIQKTNAIINSPYAIAKISISVLGKIILEGFGDKISEVDRNQLESFVKNADPESMLELGLKLRQTFNLK